MSFSYSSKNSRSSRSRSGSSKSIKRPLKYKEYYNKLKDVSDKKQLRKLNKKCICSNNESLISTEFYEKNGNYIPLIYNSIWLCFPFDEIFEDLYNLIKNEKLIYIPDPINYKENMSDENINIVLLIDNKFYKDKISILINKNFKYIKSEYNIFEDDEYIFELLEIYKINKSDPNLAVNLFIHWYNDINDVVLKKFIYNFKIKSYDGKPINFGILLNKYINNPLIDCSKDIKLALKSFLDYIYKEKNKKQLKKIEEEEEEEYE